MEQTQSPDSIPNHSLELRIPTDAETLLKTALFSHDSIIPSGDYEFDPSCYHKPCVKEPGWKYTRVSLAGCVMAVIHAVDVDADLNPSDFGEDERSLEALHVISGSFGKVDEADLQELLSRALKAE